MSRLSAVGISGLQAGEDVNLYHYRFTPVVLPLLLATVITIMWLALAKPN